MTLTHWPLCSAPTPSVFATCSNCPKKLPPVKLAVDIRRGREGEVTQTPAQVVAVVQISDRSLLTVLCLFSFEIYLPSAENMGVRPLPGASPHHGHLYLHSPESHQSSKRNRTH